MSKQTLSSDQAREALRRGVDAVVNPVKVTLGPRGRNVMLDRPGQPLATRDGVTVAKEVSDLPNRFENMGAAYAREVADAAVTEAGDGTTTATVLLQAIVTEGLRLVSAGAEPLLLADGIHMAAQACARSVRRMAVEATPELVKQVAVISTHGDVDLGSMIAEATLKVKEHGVIELNESRDHQTTVEYLEGFYFERGWRGPNGAGQVFVNDHSGQRCVLDNPYILLSERIIVGGQPNITGDHIFNILQACIAARRPLLVIAEDLTGDALSLFTTQIAAGTIPGGCFVKLPGYGETRSAALRDLQIAIGAGRIHSQASTRVDDQLSSFIPETPGSIKGIDIPPGPDEVSFVRQGGVKTLFNMSALGCCRQAIITPTRTVLIEGSADVDKKTERIRQLIQQSGDAGNPFEKEQLDHRIARLTGGVAVLRVGAHSEPAMIEKKARAEDAVHACRGALQEGVVPGGGVALLRAAIENQDLGRTSIVSSLIPAWLVALFSRKDTVAAAMERDKRSGATLLLNALAEPLHQIVRNAGIQNSNKVVENLLHHSGSWGYDAEHGTYGDLYSAGVVDPAKVTLVALLKAASIGALLLTTEALVADLPEPREMPTSNIPVVYRG
jgi:chaperonin GroEL